MPFKSDKQRRFLWSQKPEVARQIAYKQEGGLLDGLQRPEINNLEDLERVANARNQELAAVAAELGISPQDLANVQGSSADQANDIARQIWGDNAPQLREATSASESAGEMAAVMAELARQNPSWGGGQQQASSNAIQPAQQQGFWDWAVEQAGEGVDAAGTAFQDAVNYATGETARKEQSEQYNQQLENMSTEEFLQHLQNKYPENQVPAPEDVRGKSIWDRAGDALGALNPISDANASAISPAMSAAALLPNPSLGAPAAQGGFAPALAGALGPGGNQARGVSLNESRDSALWRAQTEDPQRVYNKGMLWGGSWGTETPEQIAERQAEGERAFMQHTGFAVPEQGTFLDQQFKNQIDSGDEDPGWRSEDRDYWGGGQGSADMDRTVTYEDGSQANAMTAQGDASIQAVLDNPGGSLGYGHYDDFSDNNDNEPSYSGWDDGDDDSDWDDDFDTGGGWDYDDEEEAIGYTEPSGGGDDSGGGGGGGK